MQKNEEAKNLEGKIAQWNIKMLHVSDVIEELNKCQALWKYLEMILECKECDSQLIEEVKEFKDIN